MSTVVDITAKLNAAKAAKAEADWNKHNNRLLAGVEMLAPAIKAMREAELTLDEVASVLSIVAAKIHEAKRAKHD